MRKFSKLVKMGCLTLSIAAASQTLYANANNKDKLISNEDQAVVNIVFNEQDAKDYAESMKQTLEFVIEDLKDDMTNTDDADKVKYIKNLIQQVEDVEPWDLFNEAEDNTFNLEIPYANKEINIDDETYFTDSQGYFSLNGEADIQVCDIDLLEDSDVSVDEATNKVVVSLSFDEFAEGAARMAEGMMDSAGQVTQVFYSRVKPGKTMGNGFGKTLVHFDTNIVGCNKHDKNTDSIGKKDFAKQNSDCSQAVKIGLLVLSGNLPYTYIDSVHCVNEAMDGIEDPSKPNEYCNGTKKSGGHVNCSWFKGIGHSEAFHTHKY